MRDIVVFMTLLGLIPWSLKRPMVGVAVYVVISIMNPHQLTWSAARDFPWAWIYAVVTTIAAVRFHGDRIREALRLHRLPLLLLAWTVISTVFAMDSGMSLPHLIAFAKVQYGVVIALICMRDIKDVRIMVAVLAGSIAFYGVKGFVFMLGTGGNYRVNGPNNTTIGDNNHLALAMTMAIPLLYWLATQATRKWVRAILWLSIAGCVFSTLGTYSRGGFLALGVVAMAMVARSPRKLQITLLMLPVIAIALAFMPDAFWDRMNTIDDYKQDGSATGRINAWITSFNVANARLTGGGFAFFQNAANYIAFSPPNPFPRATHSIYFQALGDHGWIGLALFLMIYVGALLKTFSARRYASDPQSRAHNELLRAMQISFLAYLTGGTFLSLAFWDYAFYLAAALAVLHATRTAPIENPLPVEGQLAAEPGPAHRNIFDRQPPAAGHA